MENKKIIDYVMQSPNNTNPAVLESMLEAIIGGGGTSGGKIAVFDMSKIDTYEQVPLDEETTLFKLSDEVPTTDELLGGFVCAMTEGDGRGIVIPLIGPFAEQHIQDGVVGVADDMPIMMLVTSEMAAEIPGMSTGIYLYHITNRLIVYAALVWGL